MKEEEAFWKRPALSWADSVLPTMSLDQKIGQLMMVAAYSNRDKKHLESLENLVQNYHIGGLIFFQGGPHRQAVMTNYLQAKAKVPLFIAIDGEWGLSMRLDSTVYFPKQMTLGAIQDNRLIEKLGEAMGEECVRMGIQINFAPVLDINSNPANPVIGFRSFGENKFKVAQKGWALTKGLQSRRVMANGKHFPGHGDTDTDSHHSLPLLKHSRERLDSLELFPFKFLIDSGLRSMMVAHLEVPCFDTSKNCAASISANVINNILKDSLGFKGLVFTDALNMKGVANYYKPGELSVKALFAGNDILLFPEDVPAAVTAIKKALEEGLLSMEEIDMRVAKILLSKEWAGLNALKPVNTIDLFSDLNKVETEVLNRTLYKNALTLLQNKEEILPLKNLDTLRIATLTFSESTHRKFAGTVDLYAHSDHFTWKNSLSKKVQDSIANALSYYHVVLVNLEHLTRKKDNNYGLSPEMMGFMERVKQCSKVVVNVMGNPYCLSAFASAKNMDALVLTYESNSITAQLAAELIFGGLDAPGRLPVSIGSDFKEGSGLSLGAPIRVSYVIPEELGISSDSLQQIDALINEAIHEKAFPGCQIYASKNGKVFYHRAFGKPTYEAKDSVDLQTIYDLASITKIASTTLATIRNTDAALLHPDSLVGKYLHGLKNNGIRQLPLTDLLSHRSGFKPFIPYYEKTMKDGKVSKKFYRTAYSKKFPVPVTDSLFLKRSYPDTMLSIIYAQSLTPGKNYVYSDINFYLLREINERVTGQYLPNQVEPLYQSLGANSLGYRPLSRFSKSIIAPTEKDIIFRKTLVHGYVHDPGAAMMGGVGGHAGLFSNANDLGKVMQLFLNKGIYGGKTYFKASTFDSFNQTRYAPENRRALGFDKPETRPGVDSPCASEAHPSSFGHSGFTGTFTWVDPKDGLVYVFLSNRVHPDAENKKLVKMGVRTKVQSILYRAIHSAQ
jgi:beta-glucosidase-like glycosyl hydrolase/CubicO group peptidase (beta-lactamase class C family)